MFRNRIFAAWAAAMVISAGSVAVGQTGRNTGLWQWSTDSKNDQSIVQVYCNGGFGTGVIVRVFNDLPVADGYQGLCLTAWHVVNFDAQNQEIKVTYKNNRTAKNCRVLAYDEPHDVAVVWVWVPPTVVAAPLAIQAAVSGDDLEFAGLGGGSSLDCCLRYFSARAAMTTNPNTIFADAALLPGDSGGPVFNSAGQLTGIVSGGWFWWDGGVKTDDGTVVQATWPARACNLEPVQAVLAEALVAMK